MRILMTLFVMAGLALNGQTWGDAENGNGTVPSFLYPAAQALFPECTTEDSNWCIWDADKRGNHIGESFLTINDVTIIFD